MQVFCANCQLSFEAPEGASGLQCPICRSALKPADGGGPDKGREPAQAAQDWSGGTLDELVAILSAPSLSARVEVIAADGSDAGEVHVIAGGVSDALIKGQSQHDALDKLRQVKNPKFRVEQRLPNPADGNLSNPGPDSGKLEERSLPILMRYCEDFVLTAGIEVWRGSENAKVDYRRGEIVGVTVGGIDAPERLAEVMQWQQGQYRVSMPPLKLTAPQPAKQAEAPVPQAQVTGRPASAGKTIFGMPALDIAAMAAAAQKQVEQARARVTAESTAAPAAAPAAPAPARPAEKAPVAAAKTMVGVSAVVPPPAEKPAAKVPTAAEAKAEAKAKTFADKKAAKREAERSDVARKMSEVAPAEKPAEKAIEKVAEKPTTVGRPSSKPEPAVRESSGKELVKEPSKDDRTLPTRSKGEPKETSVWTYMGVGFIFGLALLGVYRMVLSFLH